MKRKRDSYDASFKLKAVACAEASNNCAASRQFNIDEKLIRTWRLKKEELQVMPKSKKAQRLGKCLFSVLETDLNKQDFGMP